jgi:hypothetical protein
MRVLPRCGPAAASNNMPASWSPASYAPPKNLNRLRVSYGSLILRSTVPVGVSMGRSAKKKSSSCFYAAIAVFGGLVVLVSTPRLQVNKLQSGPSRYILYQFVDRIHLTLTNCKVDRISNFGSYLPQSVILPALPGGGSSSSPTTDTADLAKQSPNLETTRSRSKRNTMRDLDPEAQEFEKYVAV